MKKFYGLSYDDKSLAVIAAKLSSVTNNSITKDRHIDPLIIKYDLNYNITNILSEIIIHLNFEFASQYDVDLVIDSFNSTNGTSITFAQYQQLGWLRVINDEIRIPSTACRELFPIISPENYKNKREINPALENELNCLAEIKKLLDSKESLLITETLLNTILGKYTPGIVIEFLIDKKIMKSIGSSLYMWSDRSDLISQLSDRISAQVWFKLKGDNPSLAVFRKFLRMIIHCLRWPENFSEYLSREDIEYLYKFSIEMLDQENDLNDTEDEIRKYFLDAESYHHYKVDTPTPNIKLEAKSTFELVRELEDYERTFHDFFSHESIRPEYSVLLRLIIELDHGSGTPYTGIKTILKNIAKPFLVSNALSMIRRAYPEVIPFLLQDVELIPVAFNLIEEIEFIETAFHTKDHTQTFENSQKEKDQFWAELFSYVIDRASANPEHEKYGEPIAEILYMLARNVFQFNSNNYHYSLVSHKIYKDRYDKIFKDLAKRKIDRAGYYPPPRIKPNLIVYLIKEIFERIKTIPSYNNRNEFISIDPARLDLLIELRRLCEKEYPMEELPAEIKLELEALKDEITEQIFEHLKLFFETKEVEVHNYFDGKSTKFGKRGVNDFGIEIIDWGICYVFLQRSGKLKELDDVVRYNLSFNVSKDKYDDQNKEQIEKIRIYLRTLLIASIHITEHISNYELAAIDTTNTRRKLNELMKYYALEYSVERPAEKRFDVFSENLYFFNANPYSRSLHSMFYQVVNYLPEAEAKSLLIDFFAKSSDLDRLLTAINTIENRNVSERLIEQVKTIDVDQFISSKFTVTDIESALIEAVNSRDHFDLAGPLLNTIEKHFERRSIKTIETRSFLFRVKLLLALKNKDLDAMQKLEVPKREYVLPAENKEDEHRKQFYLALFEININRNYSKAIKELESLHSHEPKNLDYAFQLYRARIYKNINNG